MDIGADCYRRFLDGDKTGFEELITIYKDNLIFFIDGYVNNTAVSEDLMEDTLLDLYVHKREFTPKASFKTYLFKIARCKALNYIKRIGRRKETALCEDIAIETDFTEQFDDEQKELYSAMANMNADYREILTLTYFEDMNADEICRILNKSKKQIGNLTYRAKLQLKNILNKEGLKYEN